MEAVPAMPEVSAEPPHDGDADPAHDLTLARYAALSRQVPLLYLVLLISMAALVATHLGCAPAALVLGPPGLLCAVGLLRALTWMHRRRAPTVAQAAARLRTVARMAPWVAAGFTLWSILLYPYGTELQRSQVPFFMGITVVSVMFCLMHARTAMLWAAGLVGGTLLAFFVATRQPVLIAVALNLVLVLASLAWMLKRAHADFASLVRSRGEIARRHAEAERLAAENVCLANLDALTGLPNRHRFMRTLDEALEGARASGERMAVAVLDLDGFKGVNDVHGQAVGDTLLAEAGRRLAALSGPGLTVARLGGDEFGAVLSGDPQPDEVLALGRRLCGALRGADPVPGLVSAMSGTVGLAGFPEAGRTARQMFERANYALFHAKQRRRGEAVPFTDEHETMIRDASRLDRALREADLAAELWLCFQPIVSVQPGRADRVTGFESLARWSSPVLGSVGPDRFIPAAERLGLIGRITETLLARALAEASRWPAPLGVSFNLSARDLACASTMDVVHRLVAQGPLDPGRIDLEVTETAVMRDAPEALAALAPLRRLGVHVSLDDFGSGYSSLGHVHQLRPDKIKVDRCFVSDLHSNPVSRGIVRTVLDLSRTLGAGCIVEGVETAGQRQDLASLGCTAMQGYLFGRPMPDVSEVLRQGVAA